MTKSHSEPRSDRLSPDFRFWLVVIGACLLFSPLVGCNSDNSSVDSDSDTKSEGPPPDVVQKIVGSEELILELTPRVRRLAKSTMNLTLPDQRALRLFGEEVKVMDLGAAPETETLIATTPITKHSFAVADSAEPTSRSQLNLLETFFPWVDYLEHASFYFVRGSFADDALTTFDSRMGCNGRGIDPAGKSLYFSGDIDVTWQKQVGQNGSEDRWLIVNWAFKRFDVLRSDGLLFEQVLSKSIRDLGVQERATRSLHQEYFLRLLNGTLEDHERQETEYTVFFPDVTFEHPGLSVVDINQDGWDDLYFCVMRGRNMLFRNRGDGTFDEVAAEYGLDIEGGSTSSLFADFDNDGDQDLMLGRGRRRAQYFVNDGETFVDRSAEKVDLDLPYLVSSSSAADYNGDGLLDVYLCTYSPIEGGQGSTQSGNEKWVDLFLPPEQLEEFQYRMSQAHPFTGMAGPPNLLLVNTGDGKFTKSPFSDQLAGWRKCFQSSWSDYDQDGDPDIYLSNDFSPDELWRNNGEQGFVNVTKEAGVDTLGFGMGVSWGDYNNDENIDLYASNMYSKAGKRITTQVPGLDPRLKTIARGNYLYEFDGTKFQLRSGTGQDEMPVAKAGWSWGGLFADFNNDTFADLYVASGYHTVPPEIAIDIDL